MVTVISTLTMRNNNRQMQYLGALAAVLVLSAGGCGSDPSSPTGPGEGGASGHGGANPGGGTTVSATGGAVGTGRDPSGGSQGSGGASGTGGAGGSGGTSAVVATGGSHPGGAPGTGGGTATAGGSTGSKDAGLSVGDAAIDATTGGSQGSGGATGTGGSAAGGSDGGVAGCATNELSKCTSGQGPLGSQIKCDFGGGDGNYDVTVELGGAVAGDTFVDAEMYRRMLPQLTTSAGQLQRFALTVNVRTPEGQPVQVGSTDSVPGLQIYFRGESPRLTAICHTTASKPIMLWLGACCA